MADTAITSMTAILGSAVDAAADVLPIVDVSVAGAAGNKKILVSQLFAVPSQTLVTPNIGVATGTSLRLGAVSTTTGTLALANAGSAFLTTLQAGAAAAARTYTWPTNFGVAGSVLTDAAANGTLSWATAGLANPYSQNSGSSAAIYFEYQQNSPSKGRWGVENGTTGGSIFTGSSTDAVVFGTTTNNTVEFFQNDTKRLTISGTAITSTLQLNSATLTASQMVATDGSKNLVSVAVTPANLVKAQISGFLDGGGSALPINSTTICVPCTFAGTITAYTITADTGTCTVSTWKKATGTAIPTIADSISTAGVQLSTGTAVRSTSLGDFTTATVAANDLFIFTLTAVSGVTKFSFTLEITRT